MEGFIYLGFMYARNDLHILKTSTKQGIETTIRSLYLLIEDFVTNKLRVVCSKAHPKKVWYIIQIFQVNPAKGAKEKNKPCISYEAVQERKTKWLDKRSFMCAIIRGQV